jgi:protocatechuate 3,4-dioxygenase alpha subunit
MPDARADLVATPGQTVGPFFHYALPFHRDRELVPTGRPDAVILHGHVHDGDGVGLQDALLEIRQADAGGVVPRLPGSLRRDGRPFTGWGRSSTDRTGHYWFSTVEPAPTREGAAAFFAVVVFARGVLNRLFTRVYVPGDDAALAADPLLASLDDEERARQVATREPDGSLRFDIHLQGPRETVFLAYPRHRVAR